MDSQKALTPLAHNHHLGEIILGSLLISPNLAHVLPSVFSLRKHCDLPGPTLNTTFVKQYSSP